MSERKNHGQFRKKRINRQRKTGNYAEIDLIVISPEGQQNKTKIDDISRCITIGKDK